MAEQRGVPRLGPMHIAVIVLAMITAGIHLSIGLPPATTLTTLFLVDAIVYVVLLALLYAPAPALNRFRAPARIGLLLWVVATIVAWVVTGRGRTMLGYADKGVEVVLVVLLVVQIVRARSRDVAVP